MKRAQGFIGRPRAGSGLRPLPRLAGPFRRRPGPKVARVGPVWAETTKIPRQNLYLSLTKPLESLKNFPADHSPALAPRHGRAHGQRRLLRSDRCRSAAPRPRDRDDARSRVRPSRRQGTDGVVREVDRDGRGLSGHFSPEGETRSATISGPRLRQMHPTEANCIIFWQESCKIK